MLPSTDLGLGLLDTMYTSKQRVALDRHSYIHPLSLTLSLPSSIYLSHSPYPSAYIRHSFIPTIAAESIGIQGKATLTPTIVASFRVCTGLFTVEVFNLQALVNI